MNENTPNCTYLESLGFVQILHLDHADVKMTETTNKKVHVNIKKVSFYLASDSYKACVQTLKCLEANARAFTNNSVLKNEEEKVVEFGKDD